jgi:hypothetical protein
MADKAAIETKLQELYKVQLKTREDSYRESHSYQPQDLANFRQKQASIADIIQTIASIDWSSQNGHENSGTASPEASVYRPGTSYFEP